MFHVKHRPCPAAQDDNGWSTAIVRRSSPPGRENRRDSRSRNPLAAPSSSSYSGVGSASINTTRPSPVTNREAMPANSTGGRNALEMTTG
jgi:hypothetical protein